MNSKESDARRISFRLVVPGFRVISIKLLNILTKIFRRIEPLSKANLFFFFNLQDYKERVDMRKLSICSVDPPGCTDIDDALHARSLPNGNIEVGVHIADVSHFIRPQNAMDKEAASRATTVYLVDKRIDMVPELLSSNLCSLRGNVERFAFSCIWELDKDATIINTKYHKSVIESKAALTYEEAQIIIDDRNRNDDVAKSLRMLNKLAKILKRRRMENG